MTFSELLVIYLLSEDPGAAGLDRTAAKEGRMTASSVTQEELAGNPAIPSVRCRTGGFASPSFDGYALVKRCSFVSSLSPALAAVRLRPVESMRFNVKAIEQNFAVETE